MKIYGLIGYPLEHSWSSQYFTRKFKKEKIVDCGYELFEMNSLSALLDLLGTRHELSGFNVTIPFKREVIKFLNELDHLALQINAVNCVKVTRDAGAVFLKGYNTDVPAFKASLLPLLGSHHKKALVLGTGGGASAVGQVLKELGISYSFVSRSPAQIDMITYDDLTPELVRSYNLIINTTPLGMFPDEKTFPQISFDHLSAKHLLYDLVYNPVETQFLKQGARFGAKTKNGLEMLHLQAEYSWNIWN